MKVLVTGASQGIGYAVVRMFLSKGHDVIGVDVSPCPIYLQDCNLYTHYVCDVRDMCTELVDKIQDVEILINNAGVEDTDHDIEVNLSALIDVTETYGIHEKIHSIVNIAAVSGHNGSEFPRYAASKGGVLAYTKNVAMRIAQYGATCNSVSPGGVLTRLNDRVIHDSEKWARIMESTPLKKWATPMEIAQWVYFLAVENKSMTGQDILVDNGESTYSNFVW